MDVYFNARPIELFKLVVIHCQLGFTSTRTSLNRSFGRPCSYDLNTSKYTNMYRPFGQNLAVQMDTLTLCIWTFQLHVHGPSIWTTLECIIGWSKYTSTDRPNGWSGDIQFDGPNIQSLTVHWTMVQMDDSPMDPLYYGNFDRPNG